MSAVVYVYAAVCVGHVCKGKIYANKLVATSGMKRHRRAVAGASSNSKPDVLT